MYIELTECKSKRHIRFRKDHISYFTPTVDEQGNEATLIALVTGELFKVRQLVIDIDDLMTA